MSETLLNEIRATKPEAPSALRERVRALSVQEPAREPFLDRFRFNWGWRRLVLAVPGDGRRGAGRGGRDRALARRLTGRRRPPARRARAADLHCCDVSVRSSDAAGDALRGTRREATRRPVRRSHRRPASSSATRRSSACASTTSTRSRARPSRHSRSRTTTAAPSPRSSTTRPSAGVGTAQITLRIPTAQVESAMPQLSQLGTIVGQRYGIEDLQLQADTLQTQIEQTQRRSRRS